MENTLANSPQKYIGYSQTKHINFQKIIMVSCFK